jgi:DNA-binding response OmpR family regulator
MSGKRVLLIGAPPGFADAVAPLLTRDGIVVDRLAASPAVVELVARASFHLVLIGLPAPTGFLNELLRSIRRPGGLCRNASVLLVGGEVGAPEVASANAIGANGRIDWPQPPDPLRERLAAALEIAPRKDVRVLAKIRVAMATRTKRMACQSVNVSRSGILLRTEESIEIGTEAELEFALPGDTEPISVLARVVRHMEFGKEHARGIGFVFLEYRGTSLAKLDRFCCS